MHVYHYAPYERTALSRLMGEHGTREDELDDLLRGEVLVDLYRVDAPGAARVARRATRSRTSRSCTASSARPRSPAGASRSSRSRSGSRSARTRCSRRSAPTTRRTAARSTSCTGGCSSCGRPSSLGARRRRSARPSEETAEQLERARARARASCSTARTRASRAGCSRTSSSTTAARRGRSGGSTSTTCALDEEELIDDGDTIGGLELVGEPVPDKQSLVYTFTFPRAGAQDRRRRRSIRRPSEQYDVAVDDEQGLVTLRRGMKRDEDEPLPTALIPPEPLPTLGAARRRPPLREEPGALPRARRDPRAAAAARAARRHARGRRAEPRRQLPLRPGAARLGQDVERRADGDRS